MSELQEIFKKNIKRIREQKNMQQRTLAEITGIAQARLSRIENGNADVGILTIEKIAEGLGVNPTELLIDVEVQHSSFEEKVFKANLLNEYDKRIIEGVLETFIEKDHLESMQDLKMKKRLEELNALRK